MRPSLSDGRRPPTPSDVRGVLFDFYGTLARAVSWGETHEEVFARRGLAEAGTRWGSRWVGGVPDGHEHVEHSVSRDAYRAWELERLRSRARACGVGDDELEALVADLYQATKTFTLAAYPEVPDVLAELRDRGLVVAVCSNWDWDLDKAMDQAGLTRGGRRGGHVGPGRRPQAPPQDLRPHPRPLRPRARRGPVRGRHLGARRGGPPGRGHAPGARVAGGQGPRRRSRRRRWSTAWSGPPTCPRSSRWSDAPDARWQRSAGARKLSLTRRCGLSALRSTRTTLCQVPSSTRPRLHRQHDRRAHQRRQQVVGAVAGGAVAVAVAVVAGQQAVERRHQVGLRPRAQLHQGHAGGGVGDEDVDQPVAQGPAELGHPTR